MLESWHPKTSPVASNGIFLAGSRKFEVIRLTRDEEPNDRSGVPDSDEGSSAEEGRQVGDGGSESVGRREDRPASAAKPKIDKVQQAIGKVRRAEKASALRKTTKDGTYPDSQQNATPRPGERSRDTPSTAEQFGSGGKPNKERRGPRRSALVASVLYLLLAIVTIVLSYAGVDLLTKPLPPAGYGANGTAYLYVSDPSIKTTMSVTLKNIVGDPVPYMSIRLAMEIPAGQKIQWVLVLTDQAQYLNTDQVSVWGGGLQSGRDGSLIELSKVFCVDQNRASPEFSGRLVEIRRTSSGYEVYVPSSDPNKGCSERMGHGDSRNDSSGVGPSRPSQVVTGSVTGGSPTPGVHEQDRQKLPDGSLAGPTLVQLDGPARTDWVTARLAGRQLVELPLFGEIQTAPDAPDDFLKEGAGGLPGSWYSPRNLKVAVSDTRFDTGTYRLDLSNPATGDELFSWSREGTLSVTYRITDVDEEQRRQAWIFALGALLGVGSSAAFAAIQEIYEWAMVRKT
jgi:hypothetical protein